MIRTHALAPTLGLAVLAALPLFSAPAHAQKVAVTVTDLTPTSGFYGVSGASVFRAAQVGNGLSTTDDSTHALLWTGTAASVVDLHPANRINNTSALAIDGDTQVGSGYYYDDDFGSYGYSALLWHGTAASMVFLNPPGKDAQAYAGSGGTQVGEAEVVTYNDDGFPQDGPSHAYLWHGTAASAVDLHPAGFVSSSANGVFGDIQAGYGQFNDGNGQALHALLWHGTAASVVDLNPAGFNGSSISGVSGDTEVGGGYPADEEDYGGSHALFWHGTAASAVDLHPSGYYASYARAVSGLMQVGSGQKMLYGPSHALLWHGTAQSVLDLNQFLPAALQQSALAGGVDDHNGVVKVVGTSSDSNNNQHTVLWRVVFAPTLNRISQTQRPAGNTAFGLTAKGTRFTHQSFINWNGKPLPTTFQNSEHLQTVVPAALVAHSGTAAVTVSTPGVDTSQSKTFTITL